MFRVQGEEGDLFLCLDCNLKYEQAQSLEFDRTTRHMNFLLAQAEATMGLQGILPRHEMPQRPVYHVGDTTLNNIKIDRGSIGVLNTGTIGTVDGAITVLRQHGEADVADTIARFTEAVVAERHLNADQKDEVLELLSVLATEATAPREQRRSSAMRAMIVPLATLVGGAAGLCQLWQQLEPTILGLFQ